MAGKKRRPKHQVLSDRATISEMYLTGKTQYAIGKVVGLSQQQVSRELRMLEEEWKEATLKNVDELKATELARINKLEEHYWKEYFKSQEKKTTKTSGKETDKKGAKSKASIKTEERLGDPRYLQGVAKCIEMRCKLLGIDAPTKIAPTTPDGKESYDGPVGLAALLTQAGALDDGGSS